MPIKPSIYRIALAGLGNVGHVVLSILHREKKMFQERYGVQFQVVGVAEVDGCAIDTEGLDLSQLLTTLAEKSSISALPVVGRKGMNAIELLQKIQVDIFLEATPVNLQDGLPGLEHVKTALQRNFHVVLANKGPVCLAYQELAKISDLGLGWGGNYNPNALFTSKTETKTYPKLRFSACVAGSLPAINMGWRDLAGCRIQRLEAVFNGTTQYILREMEAGKSYQAALEDAQARGIAEADPSLDVEGWDAAAKLVIAANAVLGQVTELSDVDVQGIQALDNATVQKSSAKGERMVLVCLAELVNGHYQLSVQPQSLPLDHPLSRLTPDEMGAVYYTEDVERLSVASSEPGPEPAAAAMIRDVLEIVYSEITARQN